MKLLSFQSLSRTSIYCSVQSRCLIPQTPRDFKILLQNLHCKISRMAVHKKWTQMVSKLEMHMDGPSWSIVRKAHVSDQVRLVDPLSEKPQLLIWTYLDQTEVGRDKRKGAAAALHAHQSPSLILQCTSRKCLRHTKKPRLLRLLSGCGLETFLVNYCVVLHVLYIKELPKSLPYCTSYCDVHYGTLILQYHLYFRRPENVSALQIKNVL